MFSRFDVVSTNADRLSTGGSTIFSIRSSEISQSELRRDLESHFRPVFQRFVYGGEKIANHDLRRLLADNRYRSILPPERVQDLLDLIDFNPGKAISYQEFVKIVTGTTDYGSDIGFGDGPQHYKFEKEREKGCWNVLLRNTTPDKELDEYLAHYNFIPPPFFMILITVVQIAVFIYYAVDLQGRGVSTTALGGVPMNSSIIYKPTKRHEVWRFITYCFLHQGVVDLVFNVILQLFFGFPLEVVLKFWRLAIVYFCGVITGSLGQSIADHYVGLAGAAGGCYAVLTAHIMALIANWSQLNTTEEDSRCRKISCSVPLRMVVMIILMAAQTALAIYRRFTFPVGTQIGIAAHVGGIVAGFLLGKPFMKDLNRYPWQKNSGWLDMFILLMFIGGCVIFNIVWEGYPPTDYS